jgi:hypothetical protein
MTMLTGLLSSVTPYLIAALLAGAVAAGVQYKLDQDAYLELQLADAHALVDEIAANKAASDAFAARQTTALTTAQVQLRKSIIDRNAAEAKLTAALNTEGMADAKLAACLAYRLPDGILHDLTR